MATQVRTARLGDLISVKHGYAFKGEYFSDRGPFVVLTPGNFHEEGGFRSKGEKEKFYAGPVPDEFILKRGDLIVAMTEQAEGLLGSSALVPASGLYLHNQRLGLVRPLQGEQVEMRFLYHLFNTAHVRQQIAATASGVKVRHTSPARIYDVQVALPAIATQRKIATILSAYDDLIENNTRRIKILEEMAQALYREKLGTTVPPPMPLGVIATKIGSGATPRGGKESYKKEGVALIRSMNVYDYEFVDEDLARIDDQQASDLDNVAVERRDILLNITGASVARCCMSPASVLPARVNQHVAIIRVNPCLADPFAVFYALNSPELKRRLLSLAQAGATREALTKGTLEALDVPLAPLAHQQEFGAVAAAFFDLKENLGLRNANLRRTRNLLLPKLISGEIDVSDLDIDTGEAA